MFATIANTETARKLLSDHERAVQSLRVYCGRESVEACGQRRCSYFHEDQNRCALLVWNVYERLGEESLRWFATHRAPRVIEIEPRDDALAMRVGSL